MLVPCWPGLDLFMNTLDFVLSNTPHLDPRLNPWLDNVIIESNPERTAARLVYKVVRERNGAVPEFDEMMSQVCDSGLPHIFHCMFQWDEAVAKSLRSAQRHYKATRRAFPLGMYLDHLRKLIPAESLLACPVKIDHTDLDIALIYYTKAIGGEKRDRQVGHCGSNVLPNWFKGLKNVTMRGCNKQKAVAIHKLMTEHRLIKVFDSSYCPKKFRKTYTFAENHPSYTGDVSGWESVPHSHKRKSGVPHSSYS